MDHYNFLQSLRAIWQSATDRYANGAHSPVDCFDDAQATFLAAIGHSTQEVFDFVEDFVKYGEPDFDLFASIAAVRRDVFLNVLNAQPAPAPISMDDLPAKTDAIDGIEWLPRFIAKARAKLDGSMPADLMFGCGGDRNFCKSHNIHLAEFLSVVHRAGQNDQAILHWLNSRR